jgi:hypothetical protein
MNSNQPPIKHLNKESIRQQHSIGNMESNLNKEKGRERERKRWMYIYFTYLGGNTVALEERSRDHNTQHQSFGFCRTTSSKQQSTNKTTQVKEEQRREDHRNCFGGAEHHSLTTTTLSLPFSLTLSHMWTHPGKKAAALSLSSLFSHTVTHVGAPR